MPREIVTKLALDGEREYKQALQEINRAMSTMKSELALVDSAFRNNANSTEALTEKQERLLWMIRQQEEKIRVLAQAYEEVKRVYGEGSAQADNYAQKLNYANIQLDNMDEALILNSKYLEEAKNSADGCATSIDQYGNEVKDAGEESEKFGEKGKAAFDAIAAALLAAGVMKAIREIAEAFKECADAAIQFESDIAGIYKTIDGTAEELRKISDGVREMALRIPATTTEIAAVAEAAGQLGIKTKDILSFTEVMINLGVSTNMSADNAASSLARFANIVKMSADDYGRLGSVIVELGNNFATTEQEIVDMAMRIAGAGTQIGLTEAEIMGVATALSSVGIRAEMGGSAFSKLMVNMQVATENGKKANEAIDQTGMSLRDLQLYADESKKGFVNLAKNLGLTSDELKKLMKNADDLENFAQIAGMTADEFTKAFGKNAVDTIAKFFQGLSSGGESAISTLTEMGVTEVRLRDTMLRLTNAQELVTDAVSSANTAWIENTALAIEAGKRYETTESKIQIFNNSINDLKISVGDVFTPIIKKAADAGTELVGGLSNFVQENPGVIAAISGVTSAAAIYAAGIAGITAALKLAAAARAAFNVIESASPWGLTALGIAAVVAGITTFGILLKGSEESLSDLTKEARNTEKALGDFGAKYKDAAGSATAAADIAGKYIDRLAELEKQGLKTNEQQAEYRSIVDKLNTLIPELNIKIDEQTGFIEGGTKALRDNTAAWKNNALEQAAQDKYGDILEKHSKAVIELYENKVKLNRAQEDEKRLIEEQAAAYQEFLDSLGLTSAEYEKLTYQKSGYLLVSTEEGIAYRKKSDELAKARDNIDKYTAAMEKNEAAVKTWDTEVQLALDTLKLIQESSNKAADSTDALGEAMRNQAADAAIAAGSTEEYGDALTTVANTGAEAMDSLSDAYDKAKDKALESIQKQVGLFDNMSSKSKISAKDLKDALVSQATYWETYTNNLKKAAEYGLDEGLIRSMSDGSTKSAEYLGAIIKDIEKLGGKVGEELPGKAQTFVDEFNGAFADAQTGMSGFADTVRDMSKNYQDAVAQMLEDGKLAARDGGPAIVAAIAEGFTDDDKKISGAGAKVITAGLKDAGVITESEAKAVGEFLTSGTAAGILENAQTLYDAVEALLTTALDVAKNTAKIESPSKEMMEVGKNLTLGVKEGVESEKDALIETIKTISQDTVKAAKEELDKTKDVAKNAASDAVREFDNAYKPGIEKARNTSQQMVEAAKQGFSNFTDQMRQAGQNAMQGLIDGAESKRGALTSKFMDLAFAANQAYNNALEVRSPSRVFARSGAYSIEGAIEGAMSRERELRAAMAQMALEGAQAFEYGMNTAFAGMRIPRARLTGEPTLRTAGDAYAAGGIQIHIDTMSVRDDGDIYAVARELGSLVKREQRARGRA